MFASFLIKTIAVISIAPYLTDKAEHTALYKTNNDVYVKTSKRINYTVMILYSSHTHTHTHTHNARAHNNNNNKTEKQPTFIPKS